MKDISQIDPPFQTEYKHLFDMPSATEAPLPSAVECELPVIDLRQLSGGEREREECKQAIAAASREWGFFQVVNHGISRDILETMRAEQIKVFRRPFREKAVKGRCDVATIDSDTLTGSYRWGTPTARSVDQLAWSEAYHVPLSTAISAADHNGGDLLCSTMEKCGRTMSELAQKLAEILAEKMGHKSTFFRQTCLASTCYLRMNRYPACPITSHVFGLMPHTDSDFITVLHQDQIGGLQLVKDGKWIAVKPNPDALIINIGDLFQAWSNGVYKSVEHRVMTNMLKERFSLAFFLCPSYDTVIRSCADPAIYKKFSFREYRDQVQKDVMKFGYKVGLPQFLA